jgi:hypothetical protein
MKMPSLITTLLPIDFKDELSVATLMHQGAAAGTINYLKQNMPISRDLTPLLFIMLYFFRFWFRICPAMLIR